MDRGFWIPDNYVVIDDFLISEHIDALVEISRGLVVEGDEVLIIHNQYNRHGERISSPSNFQKVFGDIFCSKKSEALQLLNRLAPNKMPLFEYADLHLVLTGKNHRFPIHEDVVDKLLSIVVYLSPSANRGTLLYSGPSDQSMVEEVDWKVNRALVFSRRNGESFHSYESDGMSQRVCLVFNLMTRDLLASYRAEGLSFGKYLFDRFISHLRSVYIRVFGIQDKRSHK